MDDGCSKRVTRRESALDYARRGLAVFPLSPIRDGVCACRRPDCGDHAGKHPLAPLAPHGLLDATTDEPAIKTWWRSWPDANVGVRLGDGIFAVDVDPRHRGDETLARLEREHGPLPQTWETLTGGGGRHVFFRAPSGVRIPSRSRALGEGLDIKSDGGYVVGVESGHLNGRTYTWEVSSHPDDVALADAPAWLLARAVADAETNGQKAPFAMPDKIRAGERNSTLFASARSLRARGYSAKAILAALEAENAEKCEPPLEAGELADMVQHAMTAPDRPDFAEARTANAEGFHTTDQGNAERFATQHVGRIRYAWAEDRYLWWDGRRFSRHDAEGHALELAKVTARGIYGEADRETDPDRRKRLATWAARSESEARLRAMLALAQSEPGMALAPDELDADGDLLNVDNGLLDTRTGTLGPHDPAKRCTKLAPVAYDPDATCPRFIRFLGTVFGGRAPLIEFIQRAVGYALTADTSEQCLFVLYGKGANGKSTLLRVIGDLLGDYARTTPTETLLVQRGEAPRNDVMRLRGARFVSANEAEGRRHLSESLVKSLTGSDVTAARALYQEFDQFVPTFKVFLSVNHHPRITGTDKGIWRRIRLVPFDVTIPDAEQDKHLGDALRAEGPGILAWMVRGALAWRRDGLQPPSEVTEATADYRRGQDTLGPFLDEACVCAPGASVAIGELYARYVAWAEKNREQTLPKREFGVRMLERDGVTRDRTGTTRLWRGVRLRLDTEAPVPAETVEATPW